MGSTPVKKHACLPLWFAESSCNKTSFNDRPEIARRNDAIQQVCPRKRISLQFTSATSTSGRPLCPWTARTLWTFPVGSRAHSPLVLSDPFDKQYCHSVKSKLFVHLWPSVRFSINTVQEMAPSVRWSCTDLSICSHAGTVIHFL